MEHGSKSSVRKKVESMSPEKIEELTQYVKSIKEIKRKISEMLNETPVNEIGGPIPVDSMHLNTEE